jgi:hypothetical protein
LQLGLEFVEAPADLFGKVVDAGIGILLVQAVGLLTQRLCRTCASALTSVGPSKASI